MKFGVLGAAHGHVNDFCAEMCAAGHTLAAIWADGTDNAKALSERYGAPLLETPEDVIACGIEAAGTFAPSFQRIQMILLCEKHGVHVMSDKPLAVDWKALKELEGVVARGKIQVSAMFTVRFMPPVRKLYELIHQGELGELVSIEILNPHKLHPETRPDWHFLPEEGGSVAVDLLAHSADLFYWLTDRQQVITVGSGMIKTILPERAKFYDFASALVTSSGGVSGYYRVDWHMPDGHWNWGDLRIFCVGTKGCAEIRGTGDPLTRKVELIVYHENAETVSYPLGEKGAVNEVADFLNRIAGKPCCITGEDVVEACRQTLMIEQAAYRSRRV